MASPASVSWQKLLVCTDGSPDSQGAITASLELARKMGSQIYLLEVLTFIPGYELQAPDLLPPPPINLEMMAAQEEAVRQRLEAWKDEAAKAGVALEPRVRNSVSSYEGILEEAEAVQADLIIMGRHGFTGLSRLLMGSVTARVIGHSPCNVLVVPRETPLEFGRILVASDDSPYSAAAWQEALALTQRMGSSLIAISVATEERHTNTAREVVHQLEAEAQGQEVAVETLVPLGQPFEAIAKVAQAKQVNLIILGSHGRTGLRRLLMGSVVERVIGQAPCPVLVVKKK
jgi:nucleotide-binding universal stress UspA family protein